MNNLILLWKQRKKKTYRKYNFKCFCCKTDFIWIQQMSCKYEKKISNSAANFGLNLPKSKHAENICVLVKDQEAPNSFSSSYLFNFHKFIAQCFWDNLIIATLLLENSGFK